MLKVIHDSKIIEVFNLCDIKEITTHINYGDKYFVIKFHNNSMYILNDGYSIEF